MGMQKECIENLTPDNSAQCDMCNHIFLKDYIKTYRITYERINKSGEINLCRKCAMKWFNLINKDSSYFEDNECIYADNLDDIQSANLD